MNQTSEVMDERQKQISNRAMANGFIFVLACLIAATFYRIFTTDEIGWEFWAMLGASIVIIISRRVLGDVEQPKDLMNRPLPTGNTREEKNIRKKNYALGSLLFAGICMVMDIVLVSSGKEDVTDYELAQLLFPNLSKGVTVAVTAILSFVIMFMISYVFDYLIGEYFTVKRYNAMIAELEDDE